MTFIFWVIVLALVAGGIWAWTHRTALIARALGQPETRIKRAIERRDTRP